MQRSAEVGATMSSSAALVFFFNLLLGSGPLTTPYAFAQAGLILAPLFLVLVAFLAWITATFVVEAMASASAVTQVQPSRDAKVQVPEAELLLYRDDEAMVTQMFEITRRIEIGTMGETFFSKTGHILTVSCMVLYLYGTCSFYAVAVPQSLLQVTGPLDTAHLSLSAHWTYELYLGLFAILVIPFCFFNFQKTKYLQIGTMIGRFIVCLAMLVLAFKFVGEGEGSDVGELPLFSIGGLPFMFGVAVFVFMAHHSLPSIVAPIADKSRIHKLIGIDYALVCTVYIVLCYSAMFAFDQISNDKCLNHPSSPCKIQDLYTSNFSSFNITWLGAALALFPAFLITTYPLIVITLRNNLMQLIPWGDNPYYQTYRQIGFGLLASVPPIILAYFYQNVQNITNYTGAYAGMGIMFIIPSCLVHYSRPLVKDLFGQKVVNPYRSPFQHRYWVYLIWIWSAGVMIFNTVNFIYDGVTGKKHM